MLSIQLEKKNFFLSSKVTLQLVVELNYKFFQYEDFQQALKITFAPHDQRNYFKKHFFFKKNELKFQNKTNQRKQCKNRKSKKFHRKMNNQEYTLDEVRLWMI